MGVYGCGWVRWVAGGTGDTKTRQAGVFMGTQVRIWGLWSGKFPRTSCFGRFDENGKKWINVDANRFGCVCNRV